MCMTTITRFIGKGGVDYNGTGWQVVERKHKLKRHGARISKRTHLTSMFRYRDKPANKWLYAQHANQTISADDGTRYFPGFHIFERLEDAQEIARATWNKHRDARVVSVRYRRATVAGLQLLTRIVSYAARREAPVIVADELLITRVHARRT